MHPVARWPHRDRKYAASIIALLRLIGMLNLPNGNLCPMPQLPVTNHRMNRISGSIHGAQRKSSHAPTGCQIFPGGAPCSPPYAASFGRVPPSGRRASDDRPPSRPHPALPRAVRRNEGTRRRGRSSGPIGRSRAIRCSGVSRSMRDGGRSADGAHSSTINTPPSGEIPSQPAQAYFFVRTRRVRRFSRSPASRKRRRDSRTSSPPSPLRFASAMSCSSLWMGSSPPAPKARRSSSRISRRVFGPIIAAPPAGSTIAGSVGMQLRLSRHGRAVPRSP